MSTPQPRTIFLPRRRPRPVSRILAAAASVALALVGLAAGPTTAADPGGAVAVPMPPILAPTPAPTATAPPVAVPAGATRLPAVVRFYGRGFGHGVGLSQYGARGRAAAGQSAPTILAHYYAGTSLGSLAPATQIRVLVLEGWIPTSGAPVQIVGRLGPWTMDGAPNSFPTDSRVAVRPPLAGSTAWRYTVTSSGGATLWQTSSSVAVRVWPADASGHLELPTKPSAWDEYRGALLVVPGLTTVSVVNDVSLEEYLRGVVPAEMPATWPAEALKAQAIAARSYAAYRLRPGIGTYDTVDDTRAQVYHGLLAERPTTDAAIAATSGVVVTFNGSVANTLFHSTGGGATENNEDAFVSASGSIVAGPVPYLRGSPDRAPDGSSYDASSPYATWQTTSYTLAQLSSWFGADPRTRVGALVALDLRNRGVSGRLMSVTLIGSLGTKTVSGEVFRYVFEAHRPAADPSMRSTLVGLSPIP